MSVVSQTWHETVSQIATVLVFPTTLEHLTDGGYIMMPRRNVRVQNRQDPRIGQMQNHAECRWEFARLVVEVGRFIQGLSPIITALAYWAHHHM